MGQIGIWQILLIAVLAILLFGRGKISSIMGDVAKGINSFKRGMKEGAEEEAAAKKNLEEGATTIEMTASESKPERSGG